MQLPKYIDFYFTGDTQSGSDDMHMFSPVTLPSNVNLPVLSGPDRRKVTTDTTDTESMQGSSTKASSGLSDRQRLQKLIGKKNYFKFSEVVYRRNIFFIKMFMYLSQATVENNKLLIEVRTGMHDLQEDMAKVKVALVQYLPEDQGREEQMKIQEEVEKFCSKLEE